MQRSKQERIQEIDNKLAELEIDAARLFVPVPLGPNNHDRGCSLAALQKAVDARWEIERLVRVRYEIEMEQD